MNQDFLNRVRQLLQTESGNSAATLKAAMTLIKESRPDYYWVGLYLLIDDQLMVGPFAGPATEHKRIAIGQGVCGSAVAENRNLIVGDVSERDNYLACNLHTKSEIVVLIRDEEDRVLGQIDVDCTTINGVMNDEAWLQEVASLLAPTVSLYAKSLHSELLTLR